MKIKLISDFTGDKNDNLESWDMLMGVIEKIKAHKHTSFHGELPPNWFGKLDLNSSKEEVLEAIVETIKWHNETYL